MYEREEEETKEERERGNGPNESMNGARESEVPKNIPVFVKGTGTPATWRQDRRRRGWRRKGSGCRRGGGFRTAKAVGPRTVASTLPPLSVASRFPDTADRHRQVSESNSRSFTSQPTRIVSPSRSIPFRTPSCSHPPARHPRIIATHHGYTHVSRVVSAVDDHDFSQLLEIVE